MKNFFLKISTFALILSVVLPVESQAILAPNLPNMPSGPTVPVTDPNYAIKETGIKIPFLGVTIPISWDQVAINIAKTAIERIVDSTVVWINNGFEGGPAYVQDPARFFTSIADGVAGEIIEGSDLGFLCTPFQRSIRLSLSTAYGRGSINRTRTPAPTCTITGIKGNIEDFYRDFTTGGWDTWFSITQNDNNNPYGAYLALTEQINTKTATQILLKQQELNWNSGFQNYGPCLKQDPETKQCILRGPTITPGKVIEGQLQSVLGSNIRQLELADEFDELIGALGGALLNKTVFNRDGLFSKNPYKTSGGSTSVGGGSTSPQNSVSCSASTQRAVVGDTLNPVKWSAFAINTFGAETTFTWSGEGLDGKVGDSVEVVYTTPGPNKIAQVTATTKAAFDDEGNTISQPQTVTVTCSNTVTVSKYPPLVVSCKPSVYTARKGDLVSWIANVSGGSIVKAGDEPALKVWHGTDQTRDVATRFQEDNQWELYESKLSWIEGPGGTVTLIINKPRTYEEAGDSGKAQTARVTIVDKDPTVEPAVDVDCVGSIFITP